MGTIVVIDVVDRDSSVATSAEVLGAIDRAFGWFREVEARCSRFDATSELRQLSTRVGEAVAVSPILFEAVQFAIRLAERTDGAFDPTLGHALEAAGFNRHYHTGHAVAPPPGIDATADFCDVVIDPDRQTIALTRPLILDLGAVAKGLAVDLAARELQDFRNFAIDAGGDLYLGGMAEDDRPWNVGIRDPRDPEQMIETVEASDAAVCTSGPYERRTPDGRGHHIVDGRTRATAVAATSATVIASSALAADALATAALVLGPDAGLALLHAEGADGLVIDAEFRRHATRGFPSRQGLDARV